jgi:hypothetical protein
METKKQRQMKAIERHGLNLLAIFPNATERDPVKLCKKLRALEKRGEAVGLRLCNGPEYPNGYADADKITDAILDKVNALLKFREAGVPVFVNRNPLGCALKIDDEWMREAMGRDNFYDTPARRLYKDWGGYGIIAPEIDGEE